MAEWAPYAAIGTIWLGVGIAVGWSKGPDAGCFVPLCAMISTAIILGAC